MHACLQIMFGRYNKSISAQNDHISNHQNYSKQCHGIQHSRINIQLGSLRQLNHNTFNYYSAQEASLY